MKPTTQRLSRREFARRAGAVAASLLLASGCRPGDSSVVSLRFWNGFTGPDGRTMLRIVKRFNESHDDIQVTMQRMDWGTYYNKLFVAGLGDRAPEVFVLHTDNIERFYGAKMLTTIDPVFADGRIPVDDIDSNVLSKSRRGGLHFALPLDVHPLGMFYNRRLFSEAGIDRPPDSLAGFLDALRRLKKTSGQGTQWGFVMGWFRVIMFTLVRQYGGSIFSDNGATITLNSAACRRAMSMAADLILEQKLVPDIENLTGLIGFRQGRVGMVWEGIFMLPELRRQDDVDFAAAPVPILGDQPAVWAASHNLCVRAGLDDRHSAAALQFIEFLSRHSLDWAEGGQIPVRKSLRASQRFNSMIAQSEFAKQIPYLAYMPSVPFTFEYQTEFDLACDRVLRGSATPAVALAEASANIERAMVRYTAWGRGGAS